MKEADALTAKQARFIEEYLVDRNATQAAVRAGYAKSGAAEEGSRLLRNAKVRAALDAAIDAQQQRTQVTADRVLQELARLAFFDISQAFDADGRLLPIRSMPEDLRRAIQGFEVETLYAGTGRERGEVGITSKFKMPDKGRALELLMKHLGMFKPEEVKVEAGDSFAALVDRAIKKDEADQ